MTPPEARPRHENGVRSEEEVRRVILCAAGDEQARLGELLEQLNYRVVLGGGEADPPMSAGPVAAVVSDAVADPLGICARLSSVCPVVLVSDQAAFDFRLAATRARIAALVRRPVNPIEMSEWLAYFCDQEATDAFSVLIVDDDDITAEVSALVLRSAGILVRTLSDPVLALQAIEEDAPDLVLMDIQMPRIDGVELTRMIRQSRQFFSLPIVFLSAERDEALQMAARRLGGDDFITKPIVPEKLISLVRLRADRSRLMRSMIERDRLTGLYNQITFKGRLTQELDRCCRTGAEVSLAMIDIDFFKRVNDTYGHLTGDQVLRTLASSLVANLRRIDVIGRCGGEEFGVVLLDSGPEAAAAAIDRLRKDFGRLTFEAGDTRFSVSFSAGIASSRSFGDRTADLIASADAALYECKRNGRNTVRIAPAFGTSAVASALPG